MSVDVFYLLCTWTLCLSLSPLLYHHHPCGWLSPAKPWWSIETFGMLTPPEGAQNDEWHWSRCDDLLEVLAFFFLLYFFSWMLLDNKSCLFAVHILSIWISPCIGLSSLDISMLCLFSLPHWVMHQMLGGTSSVSMPVWKRLPNQRNKWTERLDMHHSSACPGSCCLMLVCFIL